MTNEEALNIVNECLIRGGIISKAHEYPFWETIKFALENQPKQGKWEWESTHKLGLDYGGTAYIPNFRCSCCECITESYIRFDEPLEADADYSNYCPHCGADMRGENND